MKRLQIVRRVTAVFLAVLISVFTVPITALAADDLTVSLAANPTAKAISGTDIKLDAQANGGSGNYEYRYWIDDTTDYTRELRAYSTDAAYTWTCGVTGNKNLHVDVRDLSTNKVVTDSVSFTVIENDLSVVLKINTANIVQSGTEIQFQPQITGGASGYEYRYWIDDTTEYTRELRGFASDPAFSWTTGVTGNKNLHVDVKDSTGKIVTASVPLNVTEHAPLKVSLKMTPTYEVGAGYDVFLKAVVAGGDGNYEYRYWIDDTTDYTRELRGYTAESSFTWTSGVLGNKNLHVDVKDSSGRIGTASVPLKVIDKTQEPLDVRLHLTPSGSATSGSRVELSASVTGSEQEYKYRFRIDDTAGYGFTLREYDDAPNYIWTCGVLGKKNLYVDVIGADGRQGTATVPITIIEKEALGVTLNATQTGTINSGHSVTFTAQGINGIGDYQYRYWIDDTTDYNRELRPYSSDPSYTWTSGVIGRKNLYVDVKDSTGAVATKSLQYVVHTGEALSVTLAASPQNSASSDVQVLLQSSVSGGAGMYEFKFWIDDNEGYSRDLTDFTQEASYVWTTGVTGRKNLHVTVRDTLGEKVTASIPFTVKEDLKVTFSIEGTKEFIYYGDLDKDYTNPLTCKSFAPGKTTNLRAQARGGVGAYEYRYWIDDTTDYSRELQGYSPASSYSWTSGVPGRKNLHVDVRDESGNIVTASIPLTVAFAGIDVSYHQGAIDWTKVKNSGVEFAMLRTGYGKNSHQVDELFSTYLTGVKRVGMPFGVYHYSYAESVEGAIAEAQFMLRILQNNQVNPNDLSYPITYDIEEPNRQSKALRDENTAMANAFCSVLQSAGYKTMVYASRYFFENYLHYNQLNANNIWMAAYTSKPGNTFPIDMWQYSSKGRVDGIKGNVDMNLCYSTSFNTGDANPAQLGKVVNVDSYLRVRSSPDSSSSSNVIGKIYAGDIVVILEELNGWYRVSSNSGLEGYVSSAYIAKV